jgi:hypothetical protein
MREMCVIHNVDKKGDNEESDLIVHLSKNEVLARRCDLASPCWLKC